MRFKFMRPILNIQISSSSSLDCSPSMSRINYIDGDPIYKKHSTRRSIDPLLEHAPIKASIPAPASPQVHPAAGVLDLVQAVACLVHEEGVGQEAVAQSSSDHYSRERGGPREGSPEKGGG